MRCEILMRFQMTKVQNIDARHNLPFSPLVHKESFFVKNTSYINLSTLVQGWFKLLTHEEKNDITNNEKLPNDNILEAKNDELHSLQYLENCANVARETEAYGQFE